MDLLSDIGLVESHFNPFGDSVSVSARWVHGLRRTYRTLGNRFWTHPIDIVGDVGHVECHFSLFGDSVSLNAR
jgi:hypothetical protein